MKIIRGINDVTVEGLVATIGFFDGVHLGHRFLIDNMIKIAKERNLPSAVITFSEHPRNVLQSDYQPQLLNSFEEKLAHLETTGVDYCIVLPFTPELANYPAKEFIHAVLFQKLHVKTLLIGYDHRFGRGRTDGFQEYAGYGAACGMEVLEIARFIENEIAVSSSEARRLLLEGKVEEAGKLLTYPYQIKGSIINGHKVGRVLGFPTANIRVDEPFKILPGIGVYAVWVQLQDKRYKGMLYIGNRPTLNNGDNITLEVNILDFSGDIYNNEITVSFIYFIRGNIRFNTLEELKTQLEKDRQIVSKRLTANG
ncbi:MAG: bifunctional riboflavin kinase/FAD synthetase [Tannerellaceae bacterium]|jgi:riboflavin kinase/FMN adenylyltransferase|nr:bifunctional riboflavin kinase/FAD synthetase [Tannerellaceae bacterium]